VELEKSFFVPPILSCLHGNFTSPNFVPGAEHDPSMSLTSPYATSTSFPSLMPAADIYTRKYKELRLTALTLNPDAFSSTYERESQFSDETWRVRVNGTEKVNFIGG